MKYVQILSNPRFYLTAFNSALLVILILSGNNIAFTRAGTMIAESTTSQELWGGDGIKMSLATEKAIIELDCAEANFTGKFSTANGAKFNKEGSYLRKSPGALRLNIQPKSQPARFEGEVSDDEMNLVITLIENGEVIGKYSLERNKEGRIHGCR